MWPVLLRGLVWGVGFALGSKVLEQVFDSANNDGWISKGIEETKEGLRETWTGRPNPDKVPPPDWQQPKKD